MDKEPQETKYCRYCDQDKDVNEMCAGKRKCKKCHASLEKKRRDLWSDEKRKEEYKRIHKLAKKSKESLSFSNNIEKKIKFWVSKILNRSKYSAQFESRRAINKKVLIEKCFEALEIFPEINFCFIDGGGFLRADMASLDRIDCKKPYSDDNIQVIPLWLNSAKLDLEESDFYDKIVNFCLKNPHTRNRIDSLLKA